MQFCDLVLLVAARRGVAGGGGRGCWCLGVAHHAAERARAPPGAAGVVGCHGTKKWGPALDQQELVKRWCLVLKRQPRSSCATAPVVPCRRRAVRWCARAHGALAHRGGAPYKGRPPPSCTSISAPSPTAPPNRIPPRTCMLRLPVVGLGALLVATPRAGAFALHRPLPLSHSVRCAATAATMSASRKPGVSPPEELAAFVSSAAADLIVVDVRNTDFAAEPGDAKSNEKAPIGVRAAARAHQTRRCVSSRRGALSQPHSRSCALRARGPGPLALQRRFAEPD